MFGVSYSSSAPFAPFRGYPHLFAAAAFLLGALVTRFGWLFAGAASAAGPEFVFASQRGQRRRLCRTSSGPLGTPWRPTRDIESRPTAVLRISAGFCGFLLWELGPSKPCAAERATQPRVLPFQQQASARAIQYREGTEGAIRP